MRRLITTNKATNIHVRNNDDVTRKENKNDVLLKYN